MSAGLFTDFDVQVLAYSMSSRYHQARDANKTDRSANVVSQRGQAELAANIVLPSHQDSALSHPLLDGAERVLDTFTSLPEHVRPGGEPRAHPVQDRLTLQA